MSDYEFETDAEIEEWFEETNLSELSLVEALEVRIDRHVRFAVEEPWTVAFTGSSATTTSGRIDLSHELVAS
jgi:hypothetical protein